MSKKFKPFLAHSEFTDFIYIIDENDKYEVTEQCISAMKATNRMPRWIPVSERLPEKNDVYLVAVNSFGCPTRDIDGFMAHTDRKWELYGNKVIAWMPLPSPYQPEIPAGQIVANGELYPGEFDDPLAEEGSDKE